MRARRALAHGPWVLALAAWLPACSGGEVTIGGASALPAGFAVVADIAPVATQALDVLFVIDDSDSMAEEQAALRASVADAFVAVMDTHFGARPDLHIAAVSTDMGARPEILGCSEEGEGGVMRTSALRPECTRPQGNFLIDVAAGSERQRNYEGTLGEAVGCLVEMGIDGCGFESPLEAMRRALDGSHPENAGFRREGALLAVIFLTDEDDCSAFDRTIFDPAVDSGEGALGPLSSFRCFEFGVVCDGDEPRALGPRQGCASREDSLYLYPVSEYVRFLEQITGPAGVVVAGLLGPPGPVAVEEFTTTGGDEWTLADVCTSAGASALPPIRLHGFLQGFPARSAWASICDADIAAPLAGLTENIAGAASQSPCLTGALRDIDPDAAGLQVDCHAYDARPGDGGVLRVPVPACADTGTGDAPCFAIAPDAGCEHTETGLGVSLSQDLGVALQGRLQVACAVP